MDSETEALLRIIERGDRQVAEGKVREMGDVIRALRRKFGERTSSKARPS